MKREELFTCYKMSAQFNMYLLSPKPVQSLELKATEGSSQKMSKSLLSKSLSPNRIKKNIPNYYKSIFLPRLPGVRRCCRNGLSGRGHLVSPLSVWLSVPSVISCTYVCAFVVETGQGSWSKSLCSLSLAVFKEGGVWGPPSTQDELGGSPGGRLGPGGRQDPEGVDHAEQEARPPSLDCRRGEAGAGWFPGEVWAPVHSRHSETDHPALLAPTETELTPKGRDCGPHQGPERGD